MTTHKHVLDKLVVKHDPEHVGKHSLHDNRFIIAKMGNCEHQEQYARLFANAPQMLHYLRSATAWIRANAGDVQTLDSFLSQFSDIS